jgi:hypothetical protein
LVVTRDGARSFQRIDLGEAAALAVMPVGGTLKVATSSGIQTFDADGAPIGIAQTDQGILDLWTGLRIPTIFNRFAKQAIDLAVVRRYAPLVADALGWVVALS